MTTFLFEPHESPEPERIRLRAEFIHPQNLANSPHSTINSRAAITQNRKRACLHRQARDTAAILWLQAARKLFSDRNINVIGLTPKYYTIEWVFRGVRPDVDNVVARCKPLLDGAQNALKFNDRDLDLGAVWRTRAAEPHNPVAKRVQICIYYHILKAEYEAN